MMLFWSIALALTASAGDTPADVGLATVVSDAVTYTTAGEEKAQPLSPFVKLRSGDRLQVPDGGTVDVMFFQSGHTEQWKGPTTITLSAASDTSDGSDPVANGDDVEVGSAMQDLAVLLKRAEESNGGHTLVRGEGAMPPVSLDELELADVADARTRYQEMRGKAEAGDILPELYLATILMRYDLRDDAKSVLEEATTRCPDCEPPKALLSWLTPATPAP